jgi:hypothetical protein
MPSRTAPPIEAATGAGRSNPTKKARRASEQKRAAIEVKIASADKLVAKRSAQLETATSRRASLTAKLARLTAESAELGPLAYCLREKAQFAMIDARGVMLANGRPAIAGVCSSCGSRLVRMGAI